MKNLSLIIISLLLISFSASAQKLTITVQGWNNDTIVVKTLPLGNSTKLITHDIVARDGSITIHNIHNIPVQVTAMSKQSYIAIAGGWIMPHAPKITTFIFPDTHENIIGNLDAKSINYTSSGCDFLKEYAKVRNQIKKHESAIDSLQQSRSTSNKLPEQFNSQIQKIITTYSDYATFNFDKVESLLFLLNTDLQTRVKLLPKMTSRMKDENCKYITRAIQESINNNIR